MALTRAKKEQKVEEIRENLGDQNVIYFLNYKGLKARNMSDLRNRLKEKNGDIMVVKKTLAKIALEKEGIDFDPEQLKGEVAFVFGFGDIVAPAKVISEFADSFEKVEILGALLESTEELESSKVEELASLPGKEQLRAKLVSTIAAPLSGFVGVLEGNIREFVSVLDQYAKKQE